MEDEIFAGLKEENSVLPDRLRAANKNEGLLLALSLKYQFVVHVSPILRLALYNVEESSIRLESELEELPEKQLNRITLICIHDQELVASESKCRTDENGAIAILAAQPLAELVKNIRVELLMLPELQRNADLLRFEFENATRELGVPVSGSGSSFRDLIEEDQKSFAIIA